MHGCQKLCLVITKISHDRCTSSACSVLCILMHRKNWSRLKIWVKAKSLCLIARLVGTYPPPAHALLYRPYCTSWYVLLIDLLTFLLACLALAYSYSTYTGWGDLYCAYMPAWTYLHISFSLIGYNWWHMRWSKCPKYLLTLWTWWLWQVRKWYTYLHCRILSYFCKDDQPFPNVNSLRADANLKEILVAASEFLRVEDTVYEFEVRRHALLNDCLKAVKRKAFHPTKRIKVYSSMMVSV